MSIPPIFRVTRSPIAAAAFLVWIPGASAEPATIALEAAGVCFFSCEVGGRSSTRPNWTPIAYLDWISWWLPTPATTEMWPHAADFGGLRLSCDCKNTLGIPVGDAKYVLTLPADDPLWTVESAAGALRAVPPRAGTTTVLSLGATLPEGGSIPEVTLFKAVQHPGGFWEGIATDVPRLSLGSLPRVFERVAPGLLAESEVSNPEERVNAGS